jgi:EmrB/QacA subfamily drug resistance transporter
MRPRIESRYLFFALAALAVLMAAVDGTIVVVALPQLMAGLDAPLTWVGWTLTAYQLVQVIVGPVAGKLSDTLGRKRVFMFCVGAFTVGSLLCGLAPSVGLLIVFRAIQAIGGGGLMPSAVGIVSDQFPKHRAQAIGLFTSVFPIGGIIGPVLGGYILHNWSWRELFFVNVPLGIAVIVGMHWLLTERATEQRGLDVDFVGLALFASSVLALMYGMTELGNNVALVSSPLLWGLFAASAVLFALFLRRLRTVPNPVVDYELLAKNPFLAANLYNFFFGAVAFGFFSFMPYYAVEVFGLSAFESGVVLTPRAIVMIAVSTLASLFVIRLGYRWPMLLGMLLVGVTQVLLGQGWTSVQVGGVTWGGFGLLATIVSFSGIGQGLASPASSNAGLDLAPKKAAAIAGLRGMFRQTGGVIGIASVVLALSFFPDRAHGITVIFLALTAVLVITMPLTLMIPDTARQQRQAEQRAAERRLEPRPGRVSAG